MNWIHTLDVKIQAALIASIVTMLGIFLKDVVFQILTEKREAKKDKQEVFKRYAEPLAKSAESMFWRLNEVFNVAGRAHFLVRSDVTTEFEDYKYVSTLYRLASFLGWINAVKKEQSYFKPSDSRSYREISIALHNIETALSDGPHVEAERLIRIAELWGLTIPAEKAYSLQIALESVLKKNLKKNDAKLATDLNNDNLLVLCTECANLLCSEINCSPLSIDVLSETKFQAARKLSIREAWIYRDWQVGIGDLMIKKSDSDIRDYDVMGFKEFESMLKQKDDCTTTWCSRIENTFLNLDISITDGQDVRVEQLSSTFRALAELILAINASILDESPFSKETIEAAELSIA